jgi:hypothetical protein
MATTSWVPVLICAGYRLRFAQEVTATAVVFFHRYFARQGPPSSSSSGSTHAKLIATTCLFLAAKARSLFLCERMPSRATTIDLAPRSGRWGCARARARGLGTRRSARIRGGCAT